MQQTQTFNFKWTIDGANYEFSVVGTSSFDEAQAKLASHMSQMLKELQDNLIKDGQI